MTTQPATACVSQDAAADIARRARSNLAFALFGMPPERRRDMITFYAFCRLADDIADEPGRPAEEKQRLLDQWSAALSGPVAGEHPLAAAMRETCARYGIDPALPQEILEGVAMDIHPRRFDTIAALEAYSHKVASVVGLVSIEIFGYSNPGCRDYAKSLGLALQWTNIMRDVGEDAANERIYLPTEEIARHGLNESEILGRVHDERFTALMQAIDRHADGHYQQAISSLPAADRRSMAPAEAMRMIYQAIATRMRSDGYRVFEKRYRISKARKFWLLARARLL